MARAGSRKVTNSNGYWYIGQTPDPTSREMVGSEGSLERDFICRVQTNPAFLSIRWQPVKIRYLYLPSGLPTDVELLDEVPDREGFSLLNHAGAKGSIYHPDYLVSWKTGETWLVEVKSSRYVQDPIVQRKKVVGEAFAALRGWKFHVVTDLQIRAEPFLTNARIRRRYRGLRVPPDIEAKIFDEVSRLHARTIAAVAERLAPPTDPRMFEPHIYALISQHKLAVEDQQPLGPGSNVFLPHEGRDTVVRIF